MMVGMTPDDLLDPLLQPGLKGFPYQHRPLRRSEVGELGWNVLAGDLPLPLAVIKREALEHNLAWMQRRAFGWGIDLAPHGKTTMSPQLFARQLDAGAWGIVSKDASWPELLRSIRRVMAGETLFPQQRRP